MITCIIIDDEQPSINVLTRYIEKLPQLQLIGTTTRPLEGIELINKCKPDLVFLDIQMDEMNGIDLTRTITFQTNIIFCTAYSEFATTAFDLDAVDYLMKPVPFPRFMKAIQRATNVILKEVVAEVQALPNDYLFVKTEQKGKLLKINFDDIEYIEGQKNYIAFHRGKEKIMALLNMKDVEERLPKSQFMRIHKSFIVPYKNIVAIEGNTITLQNRPEHIPIGISYKDSLIERMKTHIMM